MFRILKRIYPKNLNLYAIGCKFSATIPPSNSDKNIKIDNQANENKTINPDEKQAHPTNSHSHEWRTSNLAANLYQEIKTIKYQGWSVVVIVLTLIGGCVYLIYNNRKEIVHYFGRQGATAAQVTITDPRVVQNVELLSKQVVHDILNDERTMQVVLKFVVDLLARPDIKTSTQILTLWVLNTPEVLETTQILLNQLMADPYIINLVAKLLVNAILTEESKAGFASLLYQTFENPEMQAKAGYFLSQALTYENVHAKSSELAFQVVHQLLDDENVVNHVRDFFHQIISDELLQRKTGDALWNAVSTSLTPSMFRSRPIDIKKVILKSTEINSPKDKVEIKEPIVKLLQPPNAIPNLKDELNVSNRQITNLNLVLPNLNDELNINTSQNTNLSNVHPISNHTIILNDDYQNLLDELDLYEIERLKTPLVL